MLGVLLKTHSFLRKLLACFYGCAVYDSQLHMTLLCLFLFVQALVTFPWKYRHIPSPLHSHQASL